MATHKFIAVKLKEGGYFYRYYPNIPAYRQPPPAELQRQLQFAPPPESPLVSINTPFLYGRFVRKYNDMAGLIVELELSGEIIFNDNYTGTSEQRLVSSILVIAVDGNIYNHPYQTGKFYRVTPSHVHEINPLP